MEFNRLIKFIEKFQIIQKKSQVISGSLRIDGGDAWWVVTLECRVMEILKILWILKNLLNHEKSIKIKMGLERWGKVTLQCAEMVILKIFIIMKIFRILKDHQNPEKSSDSWKINQKSQIIQMGDLDGGEAGWHSRW